MLSLIVTCLCEADQRKLERFAELMRAADEVTLRAVRRTAPDDLDAKIEILESRMGRKS